MSERWLVWCGLCLLILGGIGAYLTFALSVTNVRWYGVLVVVAGMAQTAEALAAPNPQNGALSRGLRLALGVLYIVAGLIACVQPAGAALPLSLVLGALLVASGALRLLRGLSKESQGSRSLWVILALVSAVLGFILLTEWPVSGLWILGLFVSADLIGAGLSWCWAWWKGRATM